MESLHGEVAPFGITTTVVNPGFFRTDLTEQSTKYADHKSTGKWTAPRAILFSSVAHSLRT